MSNPLPPPGKSIWDPRPVDVIGAIRARPLAQCDRGFPVPLMPERGEPLFAPPEPERQATMHLTRVDEWAEITDADGNTTWVLMSEGKPQWEREP